MGSRKLGNYVITDYVGSGGFGSVFKAVDAKTPGRVVAIKELHKKHTRNTSIKQRFFQEAVAMARLDHPNLPRLYTFGEHGGSYYLVMEFVSGALLGDEIERTGPLQSDRAKAIMVQVLEAVSYAHRNGIIHRDLKPDNIMITEERDELTVKVLDFGIARLVGGENLTMTGEGFGTPNYMSPERIAGSSDIDHRTDIYSLGIILFEILTGKAPFASTATDPSLFWAEIRRLHESEPLPPLAPFGVPAELEAIVNKAAAKRAEDRFATADEMLAALRGGEATAELLLTTSPPAANVYVDNMQRGITDSVSGRILVQGLTPGLHSVRVEKPGYNSYKIDVSFQSGNQTPLQVAMSARSTVAIPTSSSTNATDVGQTVVADEVKTALIVLESLPAGAAVSLGGSVVTEAGQDGKATLKLDPGTHQITVKAPTGAVRREVVTIGRDEVGFSRRMSVPVGQAVTAFGPGIAEEGRSRFKRRIATSLASVLIAGLAVAAYFVLTRQAPEQPASEINAQAVAATASPQVARANPESANENVSARPAGETPALPAAVAETPKQQASKPEGVSEPTASSEPKPTPTEPPEEDTQQQPERSGEACAVVFVVGSNNQPVSGVRIGSVEHGTGKPGVRQVGRTGPQGRWRVCGLSVGSRLRVSVLGSRNAILTTNEITVGPDKNPIFLRIAEVSDPEPGEFDVRAKKLPPRRPRLRRP